MTVPMELKTRLGVFFLLGLIAPMFGIYAITPEIMEFTEALRIWQQGLGAFWGAFFGLMAIVTGVIVKAEFDRERDRIKANADAKALAAALRAEMQAAAARLGDLEHDCAALAPGGNPNDIHARTVAAAIRVIVPGFTIYKANAERLGILGSDLDSRVVEVVNYADRVACLGANMIYRPIARGETLPDADRANVSDWALRSGYLLRYCAERLRQHAEIDRDDWEIEQLEDKYEPFILAHEERHRDRMRAKYPSIW